ncbi:LysR family transcriptional regulator [Bartonella sp. HY329]|uniref:LysR family transcriptional regulator n=1 Tax=unclassified Bartonella TaxID=2645622 RepID=UPI0021CA1675|nr:MULTISPECIES: LysR family transcriptional regulator [unclassified Bartonella]UXM96416.1 LysR family transcriptional regulator [Bartonella sp. HY329]UXN10739.1 LysR family transcriptional regulator [Bartonella sp. HY328]
MNMENLNDLVAFIAVANENSFTKAAAKLGVSQSALSQTIRNLEERLGIRLLMRTTRSVSPSEAGQKLLATLVPRFDDIEQELNNLKQMRDKPSGTIRISAGEHPAMTILQPAITAFLKKYSDVKMELVVDNSFIDIVRDRFDAGVRFGEAIDQDMVAVKIGPKQRMAIVATKQYFETYGKPATPRELVHHNCINMRSATTGGFFQWEFEKNGRALNVHIDGQLTLSQLQLRVNAALDGVGLVYIPEDLVLEFIQQKRLIRVLDDWCEPFEGYYLYYPSKRQHMQAFNLFIDHIRYRGS